MARRNSPASLKAWDEAAAGAPHRLTLPNDVWWPIGRRAPELITCARILPGGRMLCAFTTAEERDAFLKSYADMGAKLATPAQAMWP